MNARRLVLACARAKWVGGAVSFALRHFSPILPIKKVYEDKRLIGFLHPSPSYQPHVLIVPKARVRTVFDLRDEDFLLAAQAAERIVADGGWKLPMYQLRINGGTRQDVMQAHFHLIPASGISGTVMGGIDGLSARLSDMDRIIGLRSRGFSVVVLIDGTTGKVRNEVLVQY